MLGPPLFQKSLCSDATDYYREHPHSDEPHDTCYEPEIGLPISTWLMILQATGAGAHRELVPFALQEFLCASRPLSRWLRNGGMWDVSGDKGIGMIRAGAMF